MDTLIERLKEHAYTTCGDAHATCGEAAAEIERLTAENERMRAAMQFIARLDGKTSTPASRMLEIATGEARSVLKACQQETTKP